jgi:hypothetical protein
LGGISGWNGCAASLFERRQVIQVLKTLLPKLAEALARKEESGSFFTQEEQYFESRTMEGRDSRGSIDDVGASVGRVVRLLDGMSGPDSREAFLFDLSRQRMQVLKTLLCRSAEASLRKEESGSFLMQAEQYFESMVDVGRK